MLIRPFLAATFSATGLTGSTGSTAGASVGALAVGTGIVRALAVSEIGLAMPTLHAATMTICAAVRLAVPAVHAVLVVIGAVGLAKAGMLAVVVAIVVAIGTAGSTMAMVAVMMTVMATVRMPTETARSFSGALQAVTMAVACMGRRSTAMHTMRTRRCSGTRLPLRHSGVCGEGRQDVDRITQGIITIHRLVTIIPINGIAVLIVAFTIGGGRPAKRFEQTKETFRILQQLRRYARGNGRQRQSRCKNRQHLREFLFHISKGKSAQNVCFTQIVC